MDKQEHIEWAKQRALKCIANSDYSNALIGFANEINKYPDLNHKYRLTIKTLLLHRAKSISENEIISYIKGA